MQGHNPAHYAPIPNGTALVHRSYHGSLPGGQPQTKEQAQRGRRLCAALRQRHGLGVAK